VKNGFFYKNVMLFDGVKQFSMSRNSCFWATHHTHQQQVETAPNWPASMVGPCVAFIEN
jgi:hypothetical protein